MVTGCQQTQTTRTRLKNTVIWDRTRQCRVEATIRVSDESLARWESHKRHPEETVEDAINRMLDRLEDEEFVEQDLLDADEARKELAEGRCVPHEEVKRRYGL